MRCQQPLLQAGEALRRIVYRERTTRRRARREIDGREGLVGDIDAHEEVVAGGGREMDSGHGDSLLAHGRERRGDSGDGPRPRSSSVVSATPSGSGSRRPAMMGDNLHYAVKAA